MNRTKQTGSTSEEDRTPRHRQHAQNICRSLDITQFERYADVSIYSREHGLCDDSLHDIFRAVAVAKLMYASDAWWGFSNANDRQKIFAFIRRFIRTGFCSPDLADFHDLYISSDEKLFNKILTYLNHILRTLLPPPTAQNYSLRNRPHNRQLPDRISRIMDCNFTVRMLYRNMY